MAPIKNKIKYFRTANGIDQRKLSEALGISRTYLSKLENQKFSPGPELMTKVCKYFSKELGEMFYIENECSLQHGKTSVTFDYGEVERLKKLIVTNDKEVFESNKQRGEVGIIFDTREVSELNDKQQLFILGILSDK